MIKETTLFEDVDKVEIAIKRLKLHEPKEGYYVAFSGGKDSVVLLDIIKKSGVKYKAYHSITNIEPPELMQFIKEYYPEVIQVSPKETFWQLVIKEGVPPTRLMRYCCKLMKENHGAGEFKVIGIRHAESVARSKRKFLEPCARGTGTRFIAPIIEWTNEDIWQYIKENNIPYCKLYNEGWERIGCLFCPNCTQKEKQLHCVSYPKYKKQFIKTFDKMIQKRKEKGLKTEWKDGAECFEWWITEKKKKKEQEETLFEPINLM